MSIQVSCSQACPADRRIATWPATRTESRYTAWSVTCPPSSPRLMAIYGTTNPARPGSPKQRGPPHDWSMPHARLEADALLIVLDFTIITLNSAPGKGVASDQRVSRNMLLLDWPSLLHVT